MIAVLAPARNMRPVSAAGPAPTAPHFAPEAQRLAQYLQSYSPWQLESLLEVQPQRAFDLYDAYRSFDVLQAGSPALLAYVGAAYRSMAPHLFTAAQLAFAQGHLRILSALYGLLRPLDGILPHRLGLTKDFRPGGQSLYDFWGEKICRALFAEGSLVVNLASVEYAKLFLPYVGPKDRVITCRFLVQRPGGARATAATVRAARGLMARHIVQNRLLSPKELQSFAADGYHFSPALSGAASYVFVKRPF